jgi:cellulose synthase/poly-beta-1,6-N-acetylglucosamine synthase-like glycosyltransferase
MNNWWILYIIDGLLFFLVALTSLYLLFYAFAALFSRPNEISKAKRNNRFIIIIPAYRKDSTVLQTVNTVLGQTYPQRLFDVVVVSDHQQEMTNMRLAQLPITLLTPNFEVSTKAKSLQYAILNLPQFKIYDCVLILDADNVVEPEFLERVNDAYETSGTKVIQMHRMSRNRDTSIARLDTIFEEINNSIFRRGHNAIGMSASLNGSGMVYDFEWFKSHIMKVKTVGEDKELEAMILREGIFIDYFENIHVYDGKTRGSRDFNSQRGRWAATQLHALVDNLRYLPSAVLNHRYDLVDKLIQWIMVPRTILMGIILVMGILLPFIYFSLAIKWWLAGAVVMFAFSLATPDHLVDDNWDRDFLQAPILVVWGLLNIVWVAIKEVSMRYMAIHKTTKRIISTNTRK